MIVFVRIGERVYVGDEVDVFVLDIDPVFVGEDDDVLDLYIEEVPVLHTIAVVETLADRV